MFATNSFLLSSWFTDGWNKTDYDGQTLFSSKLNLFQQFKKKKKKCTKKYKKSINVKKKRNERKTRTQTKRNKILTIQ